MKVTELLENGPVQLTPPRPRKTPVYDPASLRGQQVAANKRRLNSYYGIVDSQIAGMPCKLGITSIKAGHASNEWDLGSAGDVEFDVLDSKGRPAPWLQRKMSRADQSRVEDDAWSWIDANIKNDD